MTAKSLGWKMFDGGGKARWCQGHDRQHLIFCSSLNFKKSSGFAADSRGSVLSSKAQGFSDSNSQRPTAIAVLVATLVKPGYILP